MTEQNVIIFSFITKKIVKFHCKFATQCNLMCQYCFSVRPWTFIAILRVIFILLLLIHYVLLLLSLSLDTIFLTVNHFGLASFVLTVLYK